MGKNPPKKDIEYALTLNQEQAQAIVHACEVYIRMSIAQISTAVSLTLDTPTESMPIIKELCDSLKFVITGMSPNASYGIGSKEMSRTTHIVHAIEQTVRHRLAWDRSPEGGVTVDFGLPITFGGVELPKITNNLEKTVDGFLTHKPKPRNGDNYIIREPDQYYKSSTFVKIKKIKGIYYLINTESSYKEKYDAIGDTAYQWKPCSKEEVKNEKD